jgi:hypothetical protein
MFEIDDKGKIFTNVERKMPTPSIVQTTIHLLRGTIHVKTDWRLKDELDRDETFLSMTDVQVFNADGTILHETKFLAV